MKADQGRPWDFPAKTPSTESRHEKIPRTGAVSVPHSSFAQRAAPLARYSLPSGQVPPFRPNRQLVSSCIAESTLGTRNRQDTPCRPGPVGWPAPQQRTRPGHATPAASHPKGHHDIDGPQSCDRNSHTSHPDPTGRDRPVPRADSPHARSAGATDNGRRERPDGPIWISVSICGQTPQS